MRTIALVGTVALGIALNPASAANAGEEPTKLDTIEVIAEPWDPPQPKIRYRPAFPMSALHRWEEGCVVLRYTIRADGHTDDFAVMESNPVGVFEKNVIAAVFKWKFEPSDEVRTLVEKFEFRNSRLSTSPVKSVVSYAVPIDDNRSGSATQPMITTAGYQSPRCEDWDKTHDRDDHGPELLRVTEPVETSRAGQAGASGQMSAKRSYR